MGEKWESSAVYLLWNNIQKNWMLDIFQRYTELAIRCWKIWHLLSFSGRFNMFFERLQDSLYTNDSCLSEWRLPPINISLDYTQDTPG